jgi:adenosylcobinamide kinase / adenosylcobinamide-phosphate guanylyltransferase
VARGEQGSPVTVAGAAPDGGPSGPVPGSLFIPSLGTCRGVALAAAYRYGKPMPSTLFIGGARSGKSRLAQAAAEAVDGPLTYIATGQAFDDEMAARIARHRADRGARWRTVEEPLRLGETIQAVDDGAVLVDCLTLWLSNLILGEHDLEAATGDLLAAISSVPVPLFLVSNEIGQGIVPETPLGRAFRDEAGRLNQAVAARVDRVELVVAGLTLRIK